MSDSIKVAIKVRPLIKREKDENLTIQWLVQGNSILSTDPEIKKRGDGRYHFDHIFDMDITNSTVFDTIVRPIVDAAVNGFNGTVFAYGQTSSGKTYTMMGTSEEPGIVPLAVEYMFDAISNSAGREFLLRVSYLEIYNEKVNDLLTKDRVDLKVHEDTNGQVIVKCKEEITNCPENVLSLMKKGDKNRRIGETNMNERSSRSHTIFRITIESREAGADSDGAIQVSQLNLVDLAGSERARQTGATGERFKEGRHINLSLSTLGLVIMQLSESQDSQKHVNFRDSKLTRLLQASLGGNAMTAIICAVTPAALDETLCTLSFASRAKSVKNKPQLNEVMSDAALLKRYAKQLAKLNAELEKIKNENRSAEVEEMESKLQEKDRINQLLEDRIELLKTRIVSGDIGHHEETFKCKSKRRQTWGGPGTFKHLPTFPPKASLPTIKEMSPEKPLRKSILPSVDIMNQTFQTAFADFELELIESERDRENMEDASDSEDEAFITKRRHGQRVKFTDDVLIPQPIYESIETTPEKRNVSIQTLSDQASPSTPKNVLRKSISELTRDFVELREFTTLEKQLICEENHCCTHEEELQKLYLEKQSGNFTSGKDSQEYEARAVQVDLTQDEKENITEQLKPVTADTKIEDIPEIKEQLKSVGFNDGDNLEHVITQLCQKLKAAEEMQVIERKANTEARDKILNLEKHAENLTSDRNEFERISNELRVELNTKTAELKLQILELESKGDYKHVTENANLKSQVKDLEDFIKGLQCENKQLEEQLKAQAAKQSNQTLLDLNESDGETTKLIMALEDDKNKLVADLELKNHEVREIQDDVQGLKSAIKELEQTILLLTNENAEMSTKLSAEKERSKEAEINFQKASDELYARILKVTDEKINLESDLATLREELESIRSKTRETYNNQEDQIILRYENKIDELVAENIELSTNVMDRVEENEALRKECDALKMKLEVSLTKNTNLTENDVAQLRTENNLLKTQITELKKKITTLSDENAKFANNFFEAMEDLDNSCNEKSCNNSLHLSTLFDSTAEMCENEKVNHLTRLDNKLTDLKLSSCTQCAHLKNTKKICRALKLETKVLNHKLEDLQQKFHQKCVDIEELKIKANQEPDLSLCETTLNSTFLDGMNISEAEENVNLLNSKMQMLKDDHDKLLLLYKEKCDELSKLHDDIISDSQNDDDNKSKKSNKNGARLEHVQKVIDAVRNDIDEMKNSHSSFTSVLNKFIIEKTSLIDEINMLKSINEQLQQKVSDNEISAVTAMEKAQSLESEVTNLRKEIEQFTTREEEMASVKLTLEVELEDLKAQKKSKDAIIHDLHKTIDELNERLSSIQSELDAMTSERNELAALSENVEQKYKNELETMRKLYDELENEKRQNVEAEKRAVLWAKELEADVEKLQINLKEQKDAYNKHEEKISHLEQLLSENNTEKKILKEKLETLEAEIISSRNDLEVKYKDELESVVQKFEDYTKESENKLQEVNETLRKYIEDNEILTEQLAKLQRIEEEYNQIRAENENKFSQDEVLSDENKKLTEELEAAKNCIIKELRSLKCKVNSVDFANKSVNETFIIFLEALMSKEKEIVKTMREQFEKDKQKLIDEKRQSADAEKRVTLWAKELEAEIEKLQGDLTKRESAYNEYEDKISQLQHLLKESSHENDMLKEKLDVLETDFNNLQAEFDKQSKADVQQGEAISMVQRREREVQEAFKNKETELQMKMKIEKETYEKKVEDLVSTIESYKTKNMELNNNIEGLEANEKQLKNIIEANTAELKKSNQSIQRLNVELEQLTEVYNELNREVEDKTSRIEEITALLKNKCDMLSEYKSKLEIITPDYDLLKEQLKERKISIERYKEEIEALKMEKEKQIEIMKDELNSADIKSAGLNKQLAELSNKNIALVAELEELKDKCEVLQQENAKLERKVRNSTSKIKAEAEMEELKDLNKRLQNNLEGASNRITELQDNKTQLLKDLVDLKGQYDMLSQEKNELMETLSSYKSRQYSPTLSEKEDKYDTLLQEKNKIALELEGKKLLLSQKDKEIEKHLNEITQLTNKNKELDDELEEYAAVIRERDAENAKLEDKLYSYLTGNKVITDLEEKVKLLKEENEKLQERLEVSASRSYVERRKVEDVKLHNEKMSAELKHLEALRKENSELQAKINELESKLDLRSNSSGSRSSSPAFETSRRRHSRNEVFNQRRQLETVTSDVDSKEYENTCQILRKKIHELELQLVSKNGKIATLEMQIQSQNFPYQRKCMDLEEHLLAFRTKNAELNSEIRRLQRAMTDFNAWECDTCRRWQVNRRDQSCQTIPNSTIRFCSVNSGVVDEHVRISKLEKDKAVMKEVCRARSRKIKELEEKLKMLEEEQSMSVLRPIEASQGKSNQQITPVTCTDRQIEFEKNLRPAMKENIPANLLDSTRPSNHRRCMWDNKQ